MDLPGRRIAVTGAAGFIGRAVAGRLRDGGADVAGLDLRGGPGVAACDITDPDAVARALAGCDGVVHTAATVAETGRMADFVAVNVGGTRNVVRAAALAGARVVHVSSVAVFGYAFAHDLPDEDAPHRATGKPYIDTKAASERLARRAGARVVRPGDVYGPGSRPWTVRPVQLLREGRFVLPAPGDGVMTPVYVDDLVDCLVRALQAEGAEGVAVNAHDGAPVPAGEFFGHYARMLGKAAVPTAPRPLLEAGVRALALVDRLRGREPQLGPDGLVYISRRAAFPTTKAREAFGWEPATPLAEGMRRTEAWLRAEGLLDG